MPWFGVRSIYLFGKKSDGTNIFEERIVCFESATAAAALLKAEIEANSYASRHARQLIDDLESFEQDGDTLIDGYEVWSVLLESRESPHDFFANRYQRYDYQPE